MRKFLFAGALALAAPLYVHSEAHAGHCRLFPRLAARTAKPATCTPVAPSRPVVAVANVGRAVVAPLAIVTRAARTVCANGSCK